MKRFQKPKARNNTITTIETTWFGLKVVRCTDVMHINAKVYLLLLLLTKCQTYKTLVLVWKFVGGVRDTFRC